MYSKLGALALGALLALGLVWAQPGAAQSNSPDTTVDALNGDKVVVFFRGLPDSGGRSISQVHGKVHFAGEGGLWLKPSARYFTNKKEEKYEGPPIYLPWTSISYVRRRP
jgi:hypothetical protein